MLVVAAWLGLACNLLTDLDGLSGGARPSAIAPDAGAEAGGPAPPVLDASADADGGTTPYRDAVLADRPAGYWPMDETAGALGAVNVVTGELAPAAPGVVFGAAGVAGTAARLDGTGKLSVGDAFDLPGQDAYSLEAWIFGEPDRNGFFHIFEKRQAVPGGWNGYVSYLRQNDAQLGVSLEVSWKGGARGAFLAIPDARGRWVHVVWTYEPAAGVLLYLDGVVTNGYAGDGGPADSSHPLTLGEGWKGALDELAIYRAALPAKRVVDHFVLGRASLAR